jgi:TPP-dependent pyruvate/acetoin dehydrogenase alpha subunit
VEAVTYRQGGHSRADPAKYRPEDEVKEWLARDPIPAYRARLLEAGVDAGVLDEVEREAQDVVDRATTEARDAPVPDPSVVETQVWADGGSAWRN